MINDYKLAKTVRRYDTGASILIEKQATVSYYLTYGKLPFNGQICKTTTNRITSTIEDSLEETDPSTGYAIAA